VIYFLNFKLHPTIFSIWENQIQMEEYKMNTIQNQDALVMNYLIFHHKFIIPANLLHPFKDCHVALFWTKVHVVPRGNPPISC
jgi:hypothetical protein